MRTAFIDGLTELARSNEKIVLVVGDLGYSVVEKFQHEFPKRFFNAGIAEQNMVGMAAGLASEGYHVFVYSIANFPTFRPAEQIRNDVDYHKLSVTVVAVGGGLAYGNLGYSHHAVQDYSLMRLFPNMLIAAPGDPLETRACLEYLVETGGPSYLRLGKAGEPIFHGDIPGVSPNSWTVLQGNEQARTLILSTGAALKYAVQFQAELGPDSSILKTVPLWGMPSKYCVRGQLAQYQEVFVFEDHLRDGGFGSWLLENALTSSGKLEQAFHLRGLGDEVLDRVGDQEYLNRVGGLSHGSALD